MSASEPYAISADLKFQTVLTDKGVVEGTLKVADRRIEIHMRGPVYPNLGRDAKTLRGLAASLAQFGATAVVFLNETPIVELGATHLRWWQHFLPHTRHVTLLSKRTALRLMIGSGSSSPGVRVRDLLPPTTLLPLAPTFAPHRRPVTTTHDPRRGGNPRLVTIAAEPLGEHQGENTFRLTREVTLIGSGEQCDIRLAGLEEIHAAVIHDDRDELVVEDRSLSRSTLVNGAVPTENIVLRTGARITLGGSMLVFQRAEYADHGRPYGGRIGGELGHQTRQPDLRGKPKGSRADRHLVFPLKIRTSP